MESTSSRETILAKVRANKPGATPLPDVDFMKNNDSGSIEKLSGMLDNMGGKLVRVYDWNEIVTTIKNRYPNDGIIYSPIPEIQSLTGQTFEGYVDDHELENVEVGVIKAHFAVAENGAVWVTDDHLVNRALPFICQHLAVVISEHDILPTMHEAYQRSAGYSYKYSAFIAGASKTADIEQSLVLGAHGPRSIMVFVMNAGNSETI